MRAYTANIIAKRDGTTFGFHRDIEAKTWAEAYRNLLADLRAAGWTVIKVRRDQYAA